MIKKVIIMLIFLTMIMGYAMAFEIPSGFEPINETTYTNTDDNTSGQIIYILNNTEYEKNFKNTHNYVWYKYDDGTFDAYYTTPNGLYVGIGESNETHTVLFLNKNSGDDNNYIEQIMNEFNDMNKFKRVTS